MYGSEIGLLVLLGKPRPVDFSAILVSPKGKFVEATRHLIDAHEELEFGGYGWLKRPDWQLKFVLKFMAIIRRHNPDVVVINYEGNVPLLVIGSRLMRRPVIRMLKREVRSLTSSAIGYQMSATDRWSFLNSNGVICISKTVEQQLRDALNVGAEFPATTIYDAQEIPNFPASEIAARRAELGIADDELAVGLFARLHPVKGIENLIKAAPVIAKEFPQARFMIVGDADPSSTSAYKDELHEMARKSGIGEKFIWTNYVSDPVKVMATCDLVVHPTRAEGYGRVIVEAWSVGRAIVASDIDGTGEIIHASGGGLLHEVDDYETMARHVIQLLRDPQQRAELAALGTNWTRENCNPEHYRAQFVERVAQFASYPASKQAL